MAIDVSVLEAIAAAGGTAEAVIAAVKAQLAVDEKRRRKERNRKRAYRALSPDILGQRRTTRDTTQEKVAEAAVEPQPIVPTPPTEARDKNLHTLSSSSEDLFSESRGSENARARESRFRAEFDQWYGGYPHKVDKPAALRAFLKARKKGVVLETLIAGRERYRETKPAEIAWCNPATWLNGERWNDQPALPAARPPPRAAPTNGAASLLGKLLKRENDHVQQNANGHAGIEIDGHATPDDDRAAVA